MISFEIQGNILSCDDSTVINMELTSPIFIDDGDVLPGSYSFPFNVILDDEGKAILKHPDRIDTFKNYSEFDNVILRFDGKPLFKGKVLVMDSSSRTAKLSFVVNDFKNFEELKLNELPNLGSVNWNGAIQLLNLMADTVVHPEDHNICFFPVYNPIYMDEGASKEDDASGNSDIYIMDRFQNYWSIYTNMFVWNNTFGNESGTPAVEHPNITPFVKLAHVYRKIFEHFDFGLEDGFFSVETDLERLYLYNNKSVNVVHHNANWVNNANGIAYVYIYNINRWLPEERCIDLIKKMRELFFLCVIPNPFKKKVKVARYSDVINSDIRHDWTDNLLVDPTNPNTSIKLPKQYGYDDDSVSDEYFTEFHFDKQNQPVAYSIQRNARVNEADRLFSMKMLRVDEDGVDIETKPKDTYLAKLIPLFNTCKAFWQIYVNAYAWHYSSVPMIKCRGNVEYRRNNTVYKQESENPLRLLFYKGMFQGNSNRSGHTNPVYPYATPGEHGPERTDGTFLPLSDQNSLLWNGDKGIYNRRAKDYIDTLRYQKTLKCKLSLTITEILNYRYEDKIRIQSNNYLAKSLKITLTKQGLQPVEVELVRVN